MVGMVQATQAAVLLVALFLFLFLFLFLLLHADGYAVSPLIFPAADISVTATSAAMVVFVGAVVPQAETKTNMPDDNNNDTQLLVLPAPCHQW